MTPVTAFKPSTSTYIHHFAARLSRRQWWILLFPALPFIAGYWDWRWLLVGLMLVFLVYPFLIFLAITSYAANPRLARRVSCNGVCVIDGKAIRLFRDDEWIEDFIPSRAEIDGRNVVLYSTGDMLPLVLPIRVVPVSLLTL